MRLGKIVLILITSLLVGCQEDPICCTVIDMGFDFTVTDAQGNDLLDRDYPNSFKEEFINLYYMEEGEKVRVYNGGWDHPKNFFIYKDEQLDKFVMRVFMGGDYPVGETIIEWSKDESDTFVSEMKKLGDSGIILTKVWYQDDLVYDTSSLETASRFSLTK
ncbi:hypothetical protein JYB64_20280 [Algoriphagus aestuarii]|nr:hypothetical protein [Algoriphagus aestuarii]